MPPESDVQHGHIGSNAEQFEDEFPAKPPKPDVVYLFNLEGEPMLPVS